MSHNTSNTTAFIEAQQYSQFILENLDDGLLPDGLTRDVSDFGMGTTLNIKSVGDVTLQEVAEEQPLTYNAIDTGSVTLSITDYPGDAWSISDVLRQDGAQIDALHAARAKASTRALQEHFETRFLQVANAAQTSGNANNVNGFAHRIGATGTSQVASLDDFVSMKLAFDKANVPAGGRVAFVDPVVEATINKLAAAQGFANNPMFEGVLNEGFARDHRFVKNVFGFDVYTSNYLPTIASETIGAVTVTGGVANIFMCVADDNCKPIMRAWRQMPKVETDRDYDKKRDLFDVTARFGLGAQRVDTLGVIVTDSANY